jgi:hypothetical protein
LARCAGSGFCSTLERRRPAAASGHLRSGKAVRKVGRDRATASDSVPWGVGPEREAAGEIKTVAGIVERPAIEKVLSHLGLDPQPPPKGRARGAEQDFAA